MSWIERLLRSKLLVVTLIVVPGLWPAWPIYRQDPSVLADPLKFILLHLGFMTSVLLATVLTFTPLRVLFPRSVLARGVNRHRRLVGVSTFVYGFLHFTMHLIYEGGFGVLGSDITKPFMISGMVALSVLTVMAATSFNAALRWLGGRRWKRLHRLVYIAAPLAAYHQSLAPKLFPVQVLWIWVPLILLEVGRLIRQKLPRRTPAAPQPDLPPSTG